MENTTHIILTDADFQKEVLENRGSVLVEFGAEWCGPCQILAPMIEELVSEFEGRIKVCRLDVDHNERIPGDYGIWSLPTLLFFRSGRVVDHIIGVVPKVELTAKLKAVLEDPKGEPR